MSCLFSHSKAIHGLHRISFQFFYINTVIFENQQKIKQIKSENLEFTYIQLLNIFICIINIYQFTNLEIQRTIQMQPTHIVYSVSHFINYFFVILVIASQAIYIKFIQYYFRQSRHDKISFFII